MWQHAHGGYLHLHAIAWYQTCTFIRGQSWSYGCEIYNYLYNQWLSPLLINVVSTNPAHVEVYSINYMIKFISDLQQVGGFLHQ